MKSLWFDASAARGATIASNLDTIESLGILDKIRDEAVAGRHFASVVVSDESVATAVGNGLVSLGYAVEIHGNKGNEGWFYRIAISWINRS